MSGVGLEGVDFGTTRGEVGGEEGDEYEGEFKPGEFVVVVVEEDADTNVEQDAYHDAHNKGLKHFVFWDEE